MEQLVPHLRDFIKKELSGEEGEESWVCEGCEALLATIVQRLDFGEAGLPGWKERKHQQLALNCQLVQWSHNNLRPSIQDFEGFLESVERIKQAYVERVFSRFSPGVEAELSQRTYNILLSPQSKLVPEQEKVRNYMAYESNPDAGSLLSFVNELQLGWEDITCGREYHNDRYNRSSQKIFVSGLTVKRRDLSVVSHELAHGMSHYFESLDPAHSDRRSYENVRSCIGQSSGGSRAGGRFPKDGVRAEEDTADFFADIVHQNLLRSKCSSVVDPVTALFGQYYPIKIEPENWGEHSSDLWRALHAKMLTDDAIPLSCQRALAENGTVMPTDCRPSMPQRN